jgi:hypothetical protein
MTDDSSANDGIPARLHFPAALQPPMNCGEPNDSLALYTGPIEFTQGSVSFHAPASIHHTWLPSPRVRFEIPDLPKGMHPDLEQASIRLDDGTEIPECFVTGLNNAFGWPGHQSGLSGLVEQKVIRSKNGMACYALFLLPNFEDILGRPISYSDRSSRAARLALTGGNWKITLDHAENLKAVKDSLRSNSGFGVTHVGRLERSDGKPFTAAESWDVLNALGWYASFCSGRWTGPTLPRGYDQTGQQVWEVWARFRTSPYRQRLSWMDAHHSGHFEGPFDGFMKLWCDDTWQEVLQAAIHWYVEANAQAGSIEGAIVLTQTAFELLSSFILVEQERWLAAEPCKNLPAADRIRLLFRWAGIPTAIPGELTDLTKLAKAHEEFMLDKQPDVACAMVAIRNKITHPTRKNRAKFGKHSADATGDTWSLGLWCLELCLLRLFGYCGSYGSRLKTRYLGQVVQVPWADPNPARSARDSS